MIIYCYVNVIFEDVDEVKVEHEEGEIIEEEEQEK